MDELVGAAHGDFAKVKALLAAFPALVNANATWNETALGAAAQVGRQDIAELLLAAGAPLDICAASMLGMADRVLAFLDADPVQAQAVGAHGIPVLYYAAIRGHTDIAELLLGHGADVNSGEGTSTALHGAAAFRQPDMVQRLLDHRANVSALDYEGRTPLRQAIENGCDEIADLLRQHGGRE